MNHNILGATLLASALIAPTAFGAGVTGPITIGSVLSVTGPAAFLGDPELKTLQTYVEKINAEGGVLGRKLKLIHYDDASEAGKANGFAKRLIEFDKVDVIIGGSTTGASMATLPLVEKAGMPFISLAGAAIVVEPTRKWVFKTPHTDRLAAERVFEDMRQRGINRIALFSETSGFGRSGRREAQSLAAQYGITLLADEAYGQKDSDASAQFARIKDVPGLQAVFVFGLGPGAAVVTRNYAQLGIGLPLYQSHAVATDDFISSAGMAAEGVRMPTSAVLVARGLPADDPQKAVVTDFHKTYRDKFSVEPSAFGGYAYDALALYLDAVKRAGSTGKEKVRAAIEQTKGLIGITGSFNMSAVNHMGLDMNAFRMVEVINADWHLLR